MEAHSECDHRISRISNNNLRKGLCLYLINQKSPIFENLNMKIYTKTGDSGETGLIGGTRVPKYDLRIEAYGTVDELNSQMGLLIMHRPACSFVSSLRQTQHTLFVIGSHLANDPSASSFPLPQMSSDAIIQLEKEIDQMDEVLPKLTNFVLPGGHMGNAQAHICRTVCRRAERRVVELANTIEVAPNLIQYLNRLSDWCFTYARYISHTENAEEVVWKPRG